MKLTYKIIFALTMFAGSFSHAQEITIPNVFTPDADGVNDFFQIRTSGYDSLSVSIFNRYGALVYKFEGLNGSWDGFTHAGDKVTPGTYWVHAEAVDPNGEKVRQQSVLTVLY